MKLVPLAFAACLAGACPSWAGDQDERFIEFLAPGGGTKTYDLSTVQMLQPGRFTIVSATIDDADTMKLELKVLSILKTYCSRSEGQYPAPTDAFALGPPDMPVKSIEVKRRLVIWYYPYSWLGKEPVAFLACRDNGRTEEELYEEQRASIMSGSRSKQLFDCKRGLYGEFAHEHDDPAKAIIGVVPADTYLANYYLGVCSRVTHEKPYAPN
jgi:hypothetical protein